MYTEGEIETAGNHSTITELILLGLSAEPHIQVLLFVLFLVIYLLTFMGTLVILLVTPISLPSCTSSSVTSLFWIFAIP